MMIVNMATESLREGMILAGNVATNLGEILANEGDELTAEKIKQIQHFGIRGVFVYMDGESNEAAFTAHVKRNGFLILEEDFPKNLREIMKPGEKLHVKALLHNLNEVIKQQEEKEKLVVILEEIRENKKELFGHMISVALLSQLLAEWLGCSKDEVNVATLAGLLHDIGLSNIIDERKGTLIFKDELGARGYEKHVTDGHHQLKNLKLSQPVIRAVLSHHERIDGRGVPLKIIGAHINKIGRIIAIADAYDTYTMKYRGEYGYTVLKALQTLVDDGSHKLDSGYVQVFVENILDSVLLRMVGLSDGTTGRIVMINKYDILYPVVECKGKIVDLSIKKKLYVEEML